MLNGRNKTLIGRNRRDSVPSFLVFTLSFAVFYIMIEELLFANRSLFGSAGMGNTLVMILISFLNIAPAGIFAFSVVSVLPNRLCSKYNERRLLTYAPLKSSPRTAVLYTTFNDFIPECAKFDYEQARRLGLPMFILDDSTSMVKKREVDRFASENDCVIVRRKSRKGYKAGAINNWIGLYGSRFDCMFILDSDSKAGSDAIAKCVELARRDPRVGLVQSRTLTMTSNPSMMTNASVTIQHAHMAVVQNAMKNMGTSPYYGHNALVKIQALRDVGGLVEESNEDYKTLARMHDVGYESLYAESAVTWEETPPDYFSSRKRALRWARDAVGQLGLLRFNLPLAMIGYLFYGWATYMANAVLVTLFFMLAMRNLSLQISSMGMFAEVAGIVTVSILILWPLLSLRVSDPVLNVRSLLGAVACTTLFSIPMTAPVALQIIYTTSVKIVAEIKSLFGRGSRLIEEFVVTPKSIEAKSLGSIFLDLKVELLLGLAPSAVAILTGSVWFLLFSVVQILAIFFLPMFIASESRKVDQSYRVKNHVPISAKEYAQGYRNIITPQAMPQTVWIVAN